MCGMCGVASFLVCVFVCGCGGGGVVGWYVSKTGSSQCVMYKDTWMCMGTNILGFSYNTVYDLFINSLDCCSTSRNW